MWLLTDLAPQWYWVANAFVLGAIIGSFLNVYIYRFHTGKSLLGSSHCLSCGEPLRWYELFPVLSYLGLRGHCRTCGCYIPVRYVTVELLTAVLFAGAALLTMDVVMLALWCWALAILVVVLVYDINHFIIPDRLVVYLLVVAGTIFAYQQYLLPATGAELAWLLAAPLLGSGFLLMLWLVSKGAWLGFGDVKLAIPLGLLITPQVFSFIVLSFWIGAAVSILIVAWQHLKRGQAGLQSSAQGLTMKSAVPFAPFLIAGCLAVHFFAINVLDLFRF